MGSPEMCVDAAMRLVRQVADRGFAVQLLRTMAAPLNPLLDPDARLIIAHRGASAVAPENTIPAFELALAQEADALEMDIHLARDGTPVVVHDPTLARMAGVPVAIAALTARELKEHDVGTRFLGSGAAAWGGGRVEVPTLAEVLERFPATPLVIELKIVAAAQPVRQVLAAHQATGRCVLASFDAAAVAPFRDGAFRTGATRRELLWLLAGGRARSAESIPFAALFVPARYYGMRVPVARLVARTRAARTPVHVWTVDDPAEALRLWAAGASGIVTNRPAVIGTARPRR